MSLKAKIEAVIYASEEPVTLAQLVGLLGQEAQQELDRIAARQHQLHLAGPDDVPARHEDPATEELMAVVDQLEPEPLQHEPETPTETTPEISAEGPAAPDDAAEKRVSRERDRKL